MSVRRRLASVTPQDRDGSGRPLLWAWGRRWLAAVSGRSMHTVKVAALRGDYDQACPVSVVAWALRARGRADLADEVLAVLKTEADTPEVP